VKHRRYSFNGQAILVPSFKNTDMKTHTILTIFFCIIFLLSGCGKSNGPTPGGNTATWLVKDIAIHGGCAVGGPAALAHYTFSYDNAARIVRFDYSGCLSSAHYEIIYNSQGKITNVNYFQGNLSAPPNWLITYNGDFVKTVIPANNDTAHYLALTLSWNINNNKEFDGESFNKTSVSSGGTLFYTYVLNALQSSYSIDDLGRKQDLWASYAPNLSAPAIENPFQVGRTPEQKFLYYFLLFTVIGDWNVLGDGLPNGTYEGYSYASGNKLPSSHFFNKYTLDGNKNVSRIETSQSLDAPAFGTFSQNFTADITYEQH
jgi:hypothetical protein